MIERIIQYIRIVGMLICLMLLNPLNKPNVSNIEGTPPGSSKINIFVKHFYQFMILV